MKATVSIRTDDGDVFTGEVVLQKSEAPSAAASDEAFGKEKASGGMPLLDFSIPLRPFMNEMAEGLSGSKKFTLLVAHFVKGEVDVPVDRGEVVDAWNKMTGLLGGKFNGAHESRAKDGGFIYVPEPGKLALLKKWQKVLS